MQLSLLKRLKPKYKEALDAKREEMPTLVEGIERELDKIFYVIDVPYGLVNHMKIFFLYDCKVEFDMTHLWDIFEPNF